LGNRFLGISGPKTNREGGNHNLLNVNRGDMTVQRRGARLCSSTLTDRLTENSQSTPAHAAAAVRFVAGRYYNVSIYVHDMGPRVGRITPVTTIGLN